MRNNEPERAGHDADADKAVNGEPSGKIGVFKRVFDLYGSEFHRLTLRRASIGLRIIRYRDSGTFLSSTSRVAAARICSRSGIIASTRGGLCGGGIGCAPTRTTGPCRSEKSCPGTMAAISGLMPPSVGP